MSKTESLSKPEENFIVCKECESVYDPQKSFAEISVPNEKGQPTTTYLAGKCPNCGTLDEVLFDWSKTEIKKGAHKQNKGEQNTSFNLKIDGC